MKRRLGASKLTKLECLQRDDSKQATQRETQAIKT